jgi:hypothetical protein
VPSLVSTRPDTKTHRKAFYAGERRHGAFARGTAPTTAILPVEAVHMSDPVFFWAGVTGLLVLIGLAGLAFDRFHTRAHPRPLIDDAAQRRASRTMRYYRDIGDSTNSGGSG